jgi:hypothetical protein
MLSGSSLFEASGQKNGRTGLTPTTELELSKPKKRRHICLQKRTCLKDLKGVKAIAKLPGMFKH